MSQTITRDLDDINTKVKEASYFALRVLLTISIFALVPLVGYLSTISIHNGALRPDFNWYLYFFNYNGCISIFIGWFLTFAFSDRIFICFGLFNWTNHDTHRFSKEQFLFGAQEGEIGAQQTLTTSKHNDSGNSTTQRMSLLSRPENFS